MGNKDVHKSTHARILMLLVILSCIMLTSCGNISNEKLSDKKYLKAVFERHNKIYFYNEKKKQISELGDKSKKKELLAISPNHKKIAYKYVENSASDLSVIIETLNDGNTETLEVKNDGLGAVIELKWINDDRLMITTHINPSVLTYSIYDINSKKQINFAKGILMEIYDDGDKLLYSKTLRNDPNHKANLYLNDQLIYEMDNTTEKIQSATISEDKSKFAFKSIGFNEEKQEIEEYIYKGSLSSDNKSSNVEKIKMPPIIFGKLQLDNENNLYVVNENTSYKIEGNLFQEEKIEDDNSKNKITENKPSEEQLIVFKDILKNTFLNEFIEDYLELKDLQIYNITFF